MNNKRYTYTVSEDCTLLDFLTANVPQSRNTVKNLMKSGFVCADGKTVTKFDTPLRKGQKVTVSTENAVRSSMPFSIIYEDDDIVVINKSAGLLCVANEKEKERTAYHFLYDYMKAKAERGKIFVIHRLDRDTSGVVMFAKSEAVKRAYQDNWDKLVKKRVYCAVCEGEIDPPEGTLRSYLYESDGHMVYSTENKKLGKEAITRYRTEKSSKSCSLLHVEIDTGRKNQIRVQLADEGHPIVGDKKYGASTNPIKRLALHSSELMIMSPKGKLLDFKAPIPREFSRILSRKNV